jgi:hypothetical protein
LVSRRERRGWQPDTRPTRPTHALACARDRLHIMRVRACFEMPARPHPLCLAGHPTPGGQPAHCLPAGQVKVVDITRGPVGWVIVPAGSVVTPRV